MKKVQSREDFLTAVGDYLPTNCNAVELGVLHGEFSKMILDFINPNRLFLIDPYKESVETYGADFEFLPCAYSTQKDYDNILIKFQEEIKTTKVVVDRRFSHEAVSDYPDKTFDFLYFDGCHLYPDTKKDLTDWVITLKDGGVIAGHDYIELKSFGVIRAVDEFIKEYGFKMIVFNENGGDWALKK